MARVRSKYSRKSKYYIDPYRYLELYYKCLQYDDLMKEYNALLGLQSPGDTGRGGGPSDPTARMGERRVAASRIVDAINSAAHQADPQLADWILQGVTHKGWTYETLHNRGIPCGRRMYYETRRKFYWILDKLI